MCMNSPTCFGSKLLPSGRQNTNDGDLLPKHAGQFMRMDDKRFYINCVHLLNMRSVRKVCSHFEYLENRSCDLDVTWQPVREDLTVHP